VAYHIPVGVVRQPVHSGWKNLFHQVVSISKCASGIRKGSAPVKKHRRRRLMKSNAEKLTENVCDALTLYFITGHKPYFEQAKEIIEKNFIQKQEGNAMQEIFNWFKKFRGKYQTERRAVENAFDRWYKVNKEAVSED
jgi:hypothetical protein